MRSKLLPAVVLIPVLALLAAALSGAAGAGDDSRLAPTSSARNLPPAVSPAASAALAAAGRGSVIPPKIEDIEHMCSLMLGCPDVPMYVPTRDFGDCVRFYWDALSKPESVRASLTIRECGLGANSCQQLTRCALRGASPNGCVGRGMDEGKPVGRCDIGGRALQCYNGKVIAVRDCPRGGELCALRDGEADCVAGPCSEDGGLSKPTCSVDGKHIMQCKNGRIASINCSALGLECVNTSGGTPECTVKTTPACLSGAQRCDGASAVGCVSGHEVRVECDKASLLCAANNKDANVVGACAVDPAAVAEQRECDSARTPSRCVDNKVQYCVAGRQRSYSCKTFFGLDKCVGRPGQAHCE